MVVLQQCVQTECKTETISSKVTYRTIVIPVKLLFKPYDLKLGSTMCLKNI